MLNIIMPVYNTRIDYFKRAIYSYLSQTKKALLFVVDDHSDILKSNYYQNICQKYNIGYVRLPKNVGPGAARQYGIDYGYKNCEFISFLDADDILLPHYVDILTSEIQKNNADVIVGNVIHEGKTRNNDGKITIEDGCTWLHGKIYRRTFLEKNNIKFHPNIWFNEDLYFNLKVANWTSNRFYIDKDVYIWANNEESITRSSNYDEWFKNNNIGYFLSNLYVLEDVLRTKQPIDIGTLVGQIYNSYQEEMILNGRKQEEALQFLLYKHLNKIESWDEYLKKERFIPRLSRAARNAYTNKKLYYEGIYDWIIILEDIIHGRIKPEKTVCDNNFRKGGTWERYNGEYFERTI